MKLMGPKMNKLRFDVENNEQWREWVDKIPYLTFPPGVEVKIIPPFAGAMARFIVKKSDIEISVFLDCLDSIQSMGFPYWEMYTDNRYSHRFPLHKVDDLMDKISQELGLNHDR